MFIPQKNMGISCIWPIPKYKYPTFSQLTLPCMCVWSILSTSPRPRALGPPWGRGLVSSPPGTWWSWNSWALWPKWVATRRRMALAAHLLHQGMPRWPKSSSHQVNQSCGIITFSSKRMPCWLWKTQILALISVFSIETAILPPGIIVLYICTGKHWDLLKTLTLQKQSQRLEHPLLKIFVTCKKSYIQV